MTADVVVCGAGIGGLLCANALGARGVRVLLLEKRHEPAKVAKGEVFQPSSLGILRDLGLLSGLTERGAVELDRLVLHGGDGEELLAFDYTRLAWPERSLLSLDYHEILNALTDALPETVTYQRGATVTELLREPTGVAYTVDGERRTASAPLVVAADGVSSRLRKLAGIPAQLAEYPHRLVSFELSGVRDPAPEVSAYMTPTGLRLLYPLPGGRMRLYVQVAPTMLRRMDRTEFAGWCSAVCADTPPLTPLREPLLNGLGTRQIHTLWRFNASRLTAPGLALVGESAHSVHPMAAQGMNTTVADANALADLFAGSSTVDEALAAYETQRTQWIRHIDQISHEATSMITSTSGFARRFGRHVLRRIGGNPRMRYIATYNLAGYGMRPFTVLDRLKQLCLPDPRANHVAI